MPVGHRVFLGSETPFSTEEIEARNYYLIRLSAFKEEARGMKIWRRLDQNFAIVSFSEGSSVDALAMSSIWEVNDQWKLSANLISVESDLSPREFVLKTTDEVALYSKLNQAGLEATVLRPGLVRITAPTRFVLNELLPMNEVIYIGRESRSIVLDSRVLDMNLNPNTVNRIHNKYPELDGSGRVLSIREGAYDTEDIDIQKLKSLQI